MCLLPPTLHAAWNSWCPNPPFTANFSYSNNRNGKNHHMLRIESQHHLLVPNEWGLEDQCCQCCSTCTAWIATCTFMKAAMCTSRSSWPSCTRLLFWPPHSPPPYRYLSKANSAHITRDAWFRWHLFSALVNENNGVIWWWQQNAVFSLASTSLEKASHAEQNRR